MKWLALLLISSLYTLYPQILRAESLNTHQEIYALCYATHHAMLKDEMALYNRVNSQEIIRNHCFCTTPYILKGLETKLDYFTSCLNQQVKNDSIDFVNSRGQMCTTQSEQLMKKVVTQLRQHCNVGHKELESLIDSNKSCLGDYCDFIVTSY